MMRNTRQVILEEALRLFAKDGYRAVSVGQIASAVGIKAPSLYKHFRGKRDIFNAIVEQMQAKDAELARENALPEGTLQEEPERYRCAAMEQVRTFSKAMFLHWTEDAYGCHFRKLLTLEQYRDPQMADMYQQYFATGPLGYVTDIFRSMSGSAEEARRRALSFYAPLYLLYSVYDASEDKAGVLRAVDAHLKSFAERTGEK